MLDFLRALFFEKLYLLIIVELVALAIVVGWYRRDPTERRRGVAIAIAVCIAHIAVQHLVETDRERIQAVVRSMATAIDEGDMATLTVHLGTGFQDRGLNKQAWSDDLRQRLQRWQIDHADVGSFTIDLQGDEAIASFTASCDWRSPQQSQAGVRSTWKLAFIRRSDGWKLQRVLDAKFGPGGMFDYNAILQF